MITFDIVTIFPAMIEQPLAAGILGRAIERATLDVKVRDLRDFTTDRHRVVDDVPYGGGPGMVLKPDPIFRALDAIAAERGDRLTVIMTSPQGRRFTQTEAERLSGLQHIVLLCGRYEGVDERVAEHLATDEISVGDFVVSGGELPAAMIIDAVTRLLPGALGNEASSVNESFSAEGEPGADRREAGILDCPHYTRPPDFRGWGIPEVLLSGHHEEIRKWRRRVALEKTLRNRPELLAAAALDEEDMQILDEIRDEEEA